MSTITVSNLSFAYDGSYENIFDNVSLSIDTNWKLGLIGRNGRGKTTFLNLLMEKYEYQGKIIKDVEFDYYPFEIENKKLNSYELSKIINSEFNIDYEGWKLEKEISLLDMNIEVLNRPFETLSNGQQSKVLLAILFLKDNKFLLIDEPTNHLDRKTREEVANYLKNKHSFILVSHDRKFLDSCIDHVLSINKTNIEIEKGNFSSWYENKKRKDNYELMENKKLEKNITRLEKSARETEMWSNKVEKSKYNIKGDLIQDKGYIGSRSAKMMKRAIVTKNRKEEEIKEKSKLLKNIEEIEELKIKSLDYRNNRLIEVNNLSISYNNKIVFKDLNFYIDKNERVELSGSNGSGKSSIIKLLLGESIDYTGNIHIPKDLKISYVSQDTSYLKGTLKEYILNYNIDESLFKSVLIKLGFKRNDFEKNIENYSEGEKKKVLIARSLCEEAHLYIWDEPLNYIDVISRMQIEELILKYNPTMIFVEHDEMFSSKIATKKIEIDK